MPEPARPARLPSDLTAALVLFADRLRAAGVDASPDRVQAFLAALDTVGAGDPGDVYWVGRVTLCGDALDIARYDRVWGVVFGGQPPVPVTERPLVQFVPASPDDPTGGGDASDDQDVTAVVANASPRRRGHDSRGA